MERGRGEGKKERDRQREERHTRTCEWRDSAKYHWSGRGDGELRTERCVYRWLCRTRRKLSQANKHVMGRNEDLNLIANRSGNAAS